jgi:hypothetical protein
VVFSITPNTGLVSGGFQIAIKGKFFLHVSSSSSPIAARKVKVFLDTFECDAVIESDSSIHAIVPRVAAAGVYVVTVRVYHEYGTNFGYESYVSSASCSRLLQPSSSS